MNWENVTEIFTEDERNFNGKYLEICEVYDGKLEVSLFSSKDSQYEIYMSFGIFYGIIYVEKENEYSLRQEIKKTLVEEYSGKKEPTGDFINAFAEKYSVCLPDDIFFNFDIS